MLLSLHVKNLALIEETEVEFGEGLNILTGETGAGKSVLLGSVNLALGAKADKELIRDGAEYALVELTFEAKEERIREQLVRMELPAEEDVVVISRKLSAARSVCRINGETVTARQIKEIAELLLDIHGQHEHQSLLHKKKHMEILDAYAGSELEEALSEYRKLYEKRQTLKRELAGQLQDEDSRAREQSLLEFEYREIEQAALQPGEDAKLEDRYRLMVNGQKIQMALGAVNQMLQEEDACACELIGRAVREMGTVAHFDDELQNLFEQLSETEKLLGDFSRSVNSYREACEFDEADFRETEERLNLLNHLKEKYGNSIEKVLQYRDEISEKLEKLNDYEAYRANLESEYEKINKQMLNASAHMSEIRRRHAAALKKTLEQALKELNFLSVEFAVSISEKEPAPDGCDDVEFLISTNPGQPLRPLAMVASGGELSRIMLGVKAVLAKRDEVDTLIFDEIDAGISGKTAWRVAQKLAALGRVHQVICITHLPQIAAMADSHYLIEKAVTEGTTISAITALSQEKITRELARLLGADELSEAAVSNAEELKQNAAKIKKNELTI